MSSEIIWISIAGFIIAMGLHEFLQRYFWRPQRARSLAKESAPDGASDEEIQERAEHIEKWLK